MSDLADWPREPGNPHRYLCTADRPMPPGSAGQWSHAEAKVVGGCYEGCCDDYRCSACGTEWRKEYPA